MELENKEKTVNIKMSDARAVMNLIDILSARGAIKGEELLAVGMLRETIKKAIDISENAA